ncbi:BgTH12-03643 [Blumeria graminis f. sp. triticale]|uniref:Bgt-20232 n=3 Tax=Blumeria graminis TaxID=34373 RepID=A0A9X9PRC4_BLUGR|nr:BgTH12-03643 [Blumeria graminis f. sp. triticale]VCU39699.1 Bgt-20232 [Blumeria graminis f. sp. tritici]
MRNVNSVYIPCWIRISDIRLDHVLLHNLAARVFIISPPFLRPNPWDKLCPYCEETLSRDHSPESSRSVPILHLIQAIFPVVSSNACLNGLVPYVIVPTVYIPC